MGNATKQRILNSDLCRSEYAKVLVGMNHDIQLTIINLLNEIIADNPKRFKRTANEVLSQLQGVRKNK